VYVCTIRYLSEESAYSETVEQTSRQQQKSVMIKV